MTEAELNTELSKMKKTCSTSDSSTRQVSSENPVQMRELKRNIARVKTIIREKNLQRFRAKREEDVI